MATYKVIQDIEADDKLLGPLTLRQFIYAGIVLVSGYIAFRLALVQWWLAFPFLPHMILFAVLAAPFGRDQPSETWLLAKIRFSLKPRRRIWDQVGAKELVTITVPKTVVKHLTNGLSQDEVRSRLNALASTIDSRGWAVKSVNVNLNTPVYGQTMPQSDRLVDPSMYPQEVPNYDVNAADDIMDARNNPTAMQLDSMITASTEAHREKLVERMQTGGAPPPTAQQWFNPQPPQVAYSGATYATPSVLPEISPAEEQALLTKLKSADTTAVQPYGHLRTIQPIGQAPPPIAHKRPIRGHAKAPEPITITQPATPMPKPVQLAVTPPSDPAILELASNDDLNVATIARQAHKAKLQDGEVTISLH